jgi:hypothetical protein
MPQRKSRDVGTVTAWNQEAVQIETLRKGFVLLAACSFPKASNFQERYLNNLLTAHKQSIQHPHNDRQSAEESTGLEEFCQ